MKVLGIHRILNHCQFTSNGYTHTRPIIEKNGELFFKFKNQLHKITEFASENCLETVEEGGKIITRLFKR